MMHSWNSGIWEVGAEELDGNQGHPELHSEGIWR